MTTKISGLDVQTAPLYDLCCPVTFETGLAVSSGRAVGCAQPTCLWVSPGLSAWEAAAPKPLRAQR